MEEENIKFKKTIGTKGGTPAISLSPEMMEYLKVEMGSELWVMPQKSKHGKYLAIWSVKQKNE